MHVQHIARCLSLLKYSRYCEWAAWKIEIRVCKGDLSGFIRSFQTLILIWVVLLPLVPEPPWYKWVSSTQGSSIQQNPLVGICPQNIVLYSGRWVPAFLHSSDLFIFLCLFYTFQFIFLWFQRSVSHWKTSSFSSWVLFFQLHSSKWHSSTSYC